MGEAEYDAPPRALKARVMAEIAQTRQLPPVGGAEPGPPAGPSPSVPSASVPVPARLSRPRSPPSPSSAAVSPAASPCTSAPGIRQVEAASAAIATVLAAPDARTVSPPARTAATARPWSPTPALRRLLRPPSWPAAAERQGLPALGHRRGRRSLGRPADRSPDGSVSPVVAKDVPADRRQFGVTLEPAGGSKQPTTTPVLLLALPDLHRSRTTCADGILRCRSRRPDVRSAYTGRRWSVK